LKILHVVPSVAPAWRYGGPVVAAYGMTRALVRRGHDVTVFTTNIDGDGYLNVPTGEPVDMDGVQTTYFPVQRPRWYYYSQPMGVALRERVRDFDLVHTHSIFLWPTTTAAKRAREADVPYVVRPAGMLQADHLSKSYGSGLSTLVSRAKKQLYMATFGKSDIGGASAVHFTSADEVATSILDVSRPVSFLAPLGVDLPSDDLAPARQSLRNRYREIGDRKIILFLSRLDPVKGLDALLDAVSSLSHRDDWILGIAGGGTAEYESELAGIAEVLGLSKRVIFLGMVTGDAKWQLLREADIFVLPSYQDSFGIAAVEAMAAGVPVVVSSGVGIHQSVEEAGAGLVTAPESAALATAIGRLLDNDELRAKMGAEGKWLAEQRFSWDAVISQTETMYEEVLAGAKARESKSEYVA